MKCSRHIVCIFIHWSNIFPCYSIVVHFIQSSFKGLTGKGLHCAHPLVLSNGAPILDKLHHDKGGGVHIRESPSTSHIWGLVLELVRYSMGMCGPITALNCHVLFLDKNIYRFVRESTRVKGQVKSKAILILVSKLVEACHQGIPKATSFLCNQGKAGKQKVPIPLY